MSPDESDQPERRRGSFGRPVPGIEARVVDTDTGRDCEIDAVGELWLRGAPLMDGYYGRERHEVFTVDGWFRTGDLFTVDADGFYYFKGRRGDMIKTSGANVSPREVEAAIRGALPDHQPMVIGVDDALRGQVVVAVLIAPHDAREVDEAALRATLKETLSAYKVPRRFVRMAPSELPMLSSGKVDVRQLREVLREQ
jgi:acyl-CoA synthetase (AMP-forming)/AMP-acid ligase II